MLPSVKTPPANKPILLADALAHLRIEGDEENRYVAGLIDAATAWVENHLERALITRTYEFSLSAFPACIALPMPPLQSVVGITYTDTSGDAQTLAADQYQLKTDQAPAFVVPAYGVTWPTARDEVGSVVVEYTAGYGDTAADIPGDIVAALKLVIGQLYEHREQNVIGSIVADIKFGIDALLQPYRLYGL